MKKNNNQSAFTLVELLAVIAIIALLAGLVVSSVGSVGGSRNLANAGSSVRDFINLARNTARSHNSVTMFVIPIGVEPDKTFAVFEKAPESTDWKQITRWERLPDGVVLDQDESETFFSSSPSEGPLKVRQGGEERNYAKVLFLPNGTVKNAGTARVLYFKNENGNDRNFYKVILNPTTGIPLIERP